MTILVMSPKWYNKEAPVSSGALWIFSSVGQSIRLITGRFWVRTPEDPFERTPVSFGPGVSFCLKILTNGLEFIKINYSKV